MKQWKLIENNFDLANYKHYEGAFATGNGYFSVRGSFEDELNDEGQFEQYLRMPANVTLEKPKHEKTKRGFYIPGIAGHHPLLNEQMVNLPCFIGMAFKNNNQKLNFETSEITNYERYLNYHDGTLTRKFSWMTDGNEIKFKFKRYADMKQKNFYVQKVKIKVAKPTEIVFQSSNDLKAMTNGYNHLIDCCAKVDRNFVEVNLETDTNQKVKFASVTYIDDNNFAKNENDNSVVLEKTLHIEDEITIYKITYVTDSFHNECSIDKNIIDQYFASVKDNFEEHCKIWKNKWNSSDIVIKGDEKAQEAIRFSIYHLLRANNENSDKIAICAKGFAGEAYFGHYFWDTEIYMLPFFEYTNRKAAKNLLTFRKNTLEGAKSNAKKYGCNGAKFAWESSTNGEEQCANWQYSDLEVHINADVAYAVLKHFEKFKDEEFYKTVVLPILIETTKYWLDRVDWNNELKRYEILGVMGPDEYLAFTNNNAFTNHLVKFCLNECLNLKDTLNTEFSDSEWEIIDCIAKTLPLTWDDELLLQCSDWKQFADIDIDKIWLDKTKPFGHFISQEKNYRSKVLKQADVIALMYLFSKDFTYEQKLKALKYYEPITSHDSSLSYIVHSILAAQLDQVDSAYTLFEKALGVDLSLDKKGCSEGIHIANCGGIWQAIVFGFCGLDLDKYPSIDINDFKPSLPEHWESIEVNFENERYLITKTEVRKLDND